MRYSRTAIRELFNIVDYVSRYVNLKKRGKNYVGLCPFHQEKTPSFSVSEDKQIFHCFGCGIGGDLVQFLTSYLKTDIYDVLTLLENERGVKLIERDKDYEKRQNTINKILAINKKALGFFVNNLFKTIDGGDALKYLNKRGINLNTVKKFQLGFGGKRWDALANELFRAGFKEEEIAKSGLVVFNQTGRRDFFRNRLIFPIINQKGDIIAFGGRALDDSLPKYINSPESAVFSKRKNLYGINVAKENIVLDKTVLIVEGYIDCISMHEAGYENTVATLGTALTEEQIKYLKGFAEHFYLIYDGDEAGNKAAIKAVESFLNLGISPNVVTLPAGEDPDSLITSGKIDVLDEAVSNSKKGIDFLVSLYKNKYSLQTSEGLRSFIYSLGAHVRNIENPIEKEIILREISEITGIKAEKISQVFIPGNAVKHLQINKETNEVSYADTIVSFLLNKPDYNDYIDNDVLSELPEDYKEVINKVVKADRHDELSENAKKLYSKLAILNVDNQQVNEDAFFDTIRFIKRKKIKEEKEKINELIKAEESGASPDFKKIFMLQEEKKKLTQLEQRLLKRSNIGYEV